MNKNHVKMFAMLLFAMALSGCASQNAMSLVPESLKLELAQDKAAKRGPVSVDAMMASARSLNALEETESKAASLAKGSIQQQTTTKIAENIEEKQSSVSTAYAEPQKINRVKTEFDASLLANERDDSEQIKAMLAHYNVQQQDMQSDSETDATSVAELFQLALQKQNQMKNTAASVDLEPSVDDLKAAAATKEWNAIIATKNGLPRTRKALVSEETYSDTRIVLPSEIVEVAFDTSHASLIQNDDLKLKLLRHGGRFPNAIVIGKISEAEGFQIMSDALALGRIIMLATGGEPVITYDPTLSSGAAMVEYSGLGRNIGLRS